MYVCLRGDVSGMFRCMSNMAVYCCARWSMLLATFLFSFLHVLYIKIKYKAILAAVVDASFVRGRVVTHAPV